MSFWPIWPKKVNISFFHPLFSFFTHKSDPISSSLTSHFSANPWILFCIFCANKQPRIKLYFSPLNCTIASPAGASNLGSTLYFSNSVKCISHILWSYFSDYLRYISQILKVYFPDIYFSPLHHCRPGGPSYLGSGSTRPNSAPLFHSSAECASSSNPSDQHLQQHSWATPSTCLPEVYFLDSQSVFLLE